MKKTTKRLLSVAVLAGLALPTGAMAAEEDLMKRIEALEAKLKKVESKSLGKWLSISGDYRFRYDYLSGDVSQHVNGMAALPIFQSMITGVSNPPATFANQGEMNAVLGSMTPAQQFAMLQSMGVVAPATSVKNESVYTNRFGLNLKAKATQDVTFTARLLMYKAAGAQDDAVVRNDNGTTYSFDRSGLFDGTIGHVPGDNNLAVDRVYATWSNIAEQPIWFSIGRRPSTGGVPSQLKQNTEKPGNSGVPSLLVDYAFDGVTVGYAPDIEALPGAYAKICYGRGFSTGLQDDDNNDKLKNTDMIGLNLVPYETDALRVELQYNHAMDIFSNPIMLSGPLSQSFTSVQSNLGNIDWFGIDLMGKVSNFNWFVAGAMSKTDPNGNTLKFGTTASGDPFDTGYGLLYTNKKEDTEGYAIYLGGRYDIESSGTKLGLEYNHGTENWITFTPAADDMWTSKLGTRGDVYEAYIIQELPLEPISSHLSKAFFKIGYQYYDFKYTGSNSWLGAPIKISDVDTSPVAQLTAPLKNAQDLYVTFEVHF